jgi:hypothetical protein
LRELQVKPDGVTRSPVQDCVLQLWEAVAEPDQCLPRLAGAGLVHARVRVWVPEPQAKEQELQPP